MPELTPALPKNVSSPATKLLEQMEFDFPETSTPDDDSEFQGFTEFDLFDDTDRFKIIKIILRVRAAFKSNKKKIAFGLTEIPTQKSAYDYLVDALALEHSRRKALVFLHKKNTLTICR